jgi:hypothetical protein
MCAFLQVVEATTANGLCTMRLRALPLPAAVASALDAHADALRRALVDTSSSSSRNASGEAAAAGTGAHAEPGGSSSGGGAAAYSNGHHAGSVPADACSSAEQEAPGVDGDRHASGEASSSGRGGLQEVAEQAAGAELDALRERLLSAAAEAGGDILGLLQRAWLLGPKQVNAPGACRLHQNNRLLGFLDCQ